jgi:hypothetical protein
MVETALCRVTDTFLTNMRIDHMPFTAALFSASTVPPIRIPNRGSKLIFGKLGDEPISKKKLI